MNMSSFIKKTLQYIGAWEGTDYSPCSAYTGVLNMPGYAKFWAKCSIMDIW